MSRCPAACVSENIRCWPHRSQVIRMNHDGNAASGSSSASRPVGSAVLGSVARSRLLRMMTMTVVYAVLAFVLAANAVVAIAAIARIPGP